MDIVQELLRIDAPRDLQAAQGRPIIFEQSQPQFRYFVLGNRQPFMHELLNPVSDSTPEGGAFWIERFIQVEECGRE